MSGKASLTIGLALGGERDARRVDRLEHNGAKEGGAGVPPFCVARAGPPDHTTQGKGFLWAVSPGCKR